MSGSSIIILIFVLIMVISGTKIARERERFIVYRLGRFFGLKGPGVFFVIPAIDKCRKIKVGDQGELIAQNLARTKNGDIPVRVEGRVDIGQLVRIQGFTGADVIVVADSVQRKEFVCEKCGHINRV